MISIRPSRDIRNSYNEISKLCKENPVAITVNGREDTVIMSHEDYVTQQTKMQELEERLQVYALLAQAEDDVKLGRVFPADEVFAGIEAKLKGAR